MGSRLFVSAWQFGERRSRSFLRSLFRTSSLQLNNLLYFLLSIHIFNTDKCSELICLCRHDPCNCSLTHSWIWNHSDLIGSFYSNVSSEASGKTKKPFKTTVSLTFQVRALYFPCFPLQQAHSINHRAKAASTLHQRRQCHWLAGWIVMIQQVLAELALVLFSILTILQNV